MASTQSGRIALFAIRPQYANPILEGKKTVEFRKVKIDENVKWIVIYASSPISAIIGIVEVSEMIEDQPKNLWRKFGKTGCIEKNDFFTYYGDRQLGVAIGVQKPRRFSRALNLWDVGRLSRPPQSFCYLSGDVKRFLK